MIKLFATQIPDGGVAITTIVPEMFDAGSRTRELLRDKGIDFISDDEIVAWEIARYREKMNIPAHLKSRVIEANAVPTDRTFRDAWTDDLPTPTIDVDIAKAKEIHKDKLRELRKPLLVNLDIEYQRADEEGDNAKKQQIALKKKALRDITKTALPNNPDELKNTIPSILTEQ